MPSAQPSRPAPRRGRKPRPRLLELCISLADIEPPIRRRVRVPDAHTLHQLHRVIQLLLGWMDDHLYEFRIGERRFEAPALGRRLRPRPLRPVDGAEQSDPGRRVGRELTP